MSWLCVSGTIRQHIFRSLIVSLSAGLAFVLAAMIPPRVHAQMAGAEASNISPGYTGVWIDDTGKGAVMIEPCGQTLCGRIVWLKQATDRRGRPLTDGNNPEPRLRQRPICGLPVIGNLKRQTDGSWDGGWIYDPKEGKSYDVELRLRAPNTLLVTGYLGLKFLSETLVWKRAPTNLPRC